MAANAVIIKGITKLQCDALVGAKEGDMVFIYKRSSSAEDDDDEDEDIDLIDRYDRDDSEVEIDLVYEDDLDEDDPQDDDHSLDADESEDDDDSEHDDGSENDDGSQDEDILNHSTQHEQDDSSICLDGRGNISSGRDDGEDADVESNENNRVSEGVVAEPTPAPRMFLVSRVTKNEYDNIKDIYLSLLKYSDKVVPGYRHAYHMYGTDCVHHHPLASDLPCLICKHATSITNIANCEDFNIRLSPNADFVRARDPKLFADFGIHRRCISGCRQGWLMDPFFAEGTIKDYKPLTLELGFPTPDSIQPAVCPVCIGAELFREQQRLQAAMLLTGPPSFEQILGFHERLNPRRRRLGYEFRDFDEREWGYYFDDMQSDDEATAYDGAEMNSGWELWDEAMDPNANPETRPASAAAIAALPRKIYAQVSPEHDECAIGGEHLGKHSLFIQLPCGHVHCEPCIVTWLKSFNNCTLCRAPIPDVGECGDGEAVDADAEYGIRLGTATTRQESPDELAVKMDGADVFMS